MGLNSVDDDLIKSTKLMWEIGQLSVEPKKLEYDIEEFKVFLVKLILNDESRSSGICHIKTKINLKPKFLVSFIQKRMSSYNVEEAFPGVKLEYPVFVTTNDPIAAECMMDDLEIVDNELDKFIIKRSYNV